MRVCQTVDDDNEHARDMARDKHNSVACPPVPPFAMTKPAWTRLRLWLIGARGRGSLMVIT